MYAVIKTGGKQYRVQPGDVLVVEKLDGEAGALVKFDQVLMHGDGDAVTLGAPVIEGALVHATLIETRKGEKVKIFKKIRRQGYRRTRGHRQFESVLRVTGLELGGKTTKWDGEVDLSSKALLDARARGLKHEIAALEGSAPGKTKKVSAKAPTPAKAKAAAKEAVAEGVVDEQEAAVVAPAKAAPKAKAAPAKAEAPKTEAKAKAAPKAKAEATADKTAAPKKAAPKAKPASGKAKA